MRGTRRAVLAASLLLPLPAAATGLDADLRAALVALAHEGDMARTLTLLERATRSSPDLGAAQLLRAELYTLLAGQQLTEGLSRADGPTDLGSRESRLRPSADVDALRTELRSRAAWLGRAEGSLPINVLSLEHGIDHVILVDLSAPRLFLLARQGQTLSVAAEYYASVGVERGPKTNEGDMRTPVGAFRIPFELRGRQLRPYHGPLALVLDYPNADDRAAGRTGSHIWIHGVPPEVLARPPFSTEGCIALANSDLLALRNAIRLERTKVVIVERSDWVPAEEWRQLRLAALAQAPRTTLVALDPTSPVFAMAPRGQVSVPLALSAAGPHDVRVAAPAAPSVQPLPATTPPAQTVAVAAPATPSRPARPAAAPARPAPGAAGQPARRLAAANATTLRREPRGEALGTIASGETVLVMGERPGGWLQVQSRGRIGFVHTGHLTGS